MFDFLVQNKYGEIQSYFDVLVADSTKLQLSKLAIEKAANMIAKAIAKSEFVIQDKKGPVTDQYYYRLNVRPNDNETGTDFWMSTIYKMLTEENCKICRISDKYYIVQSCQENDTVLKPKKYTDVTIICDGKSLSANKNFTSDDMIVLKYNNEKIRSYLKNVVDLYDKTLNAITKMKQISSMPKFKLIFDAAVSLREKQPDGTDKVLTKDEYKAKIKELLEADDLSIITSSKGIDLESLKIETNITADDISKMAVEINKECAAAFDIPEAVFSGNITEKSDATNEFITYAVSPPAEVVNDSLNAKLVGMEDYLNGESITIDLTRFKHIDIIDSAANLEKLRGIGFNLDEIREMVGKKPLNTKFSQERALTKNFSGEGSENNAKNI